jgi:toxin ParE1/3/4
VRKLTISDDLIAISKYLMQHNPSAAARVLKMIRKRIDSLVSFPLLGFERNDMVLGLRCLVVKQYLIFYQPTDTEVEIVRVRHSAQSQDELFPF